MALPGPLSIVHVGTSAAVRGGGVVMVRHLCSLSQRGHHVVAVFPEPGPLTERLESSGIPVHHIGPVRSVCLGKPLRLLLRVVMHHRARLLHTHDEVVNLLGRACRAMIPSLSVVTSVHVVRSKYAGGPHLDEGGLGRARRALRYGLYRLVDNGTSRLAGAIIAHSQAIADDLCREGVPRSKVVVLRHGLPEDWFADAHPTQGSVRGVLPGGLRAGPRIGVVGAIERGKGQSLLVEAAPSVLAAEPDAEIILIGEARDHEYYQALVSRVQALGLAGRVRFAGHVDDMRAAYADLDVVVQTSHSEGLPLAVMEAMATGRPVVATEVGGTAELVTHNRTGFLFQPGDTAALAHHLRMLLASPGLRSRVGQAAREHARACFRLAPVVDGLEAIYARTLS